MFTKNPMENLVITNLVKNKWSWATLNPKALIINEFLSIYMMICMGINIYVNYVFCTLLCFPETKILGFSIFTSYPIDWSHIFIIYFATLVIFHSPPYPICEFLKVFLFLTLTCFAGMLVPSVITLALTSILMHSQCLFMILTWLWSEIPKYFKDRTQMTYYEFLTIILQLMLLM